MNQDPMEIRGNIDNLKGKIDQMLESVVAMSNLQHVVADNVGPPPGFTVVTNATYDLPLDYSPQQVLTPPHPMHIPMSN